jgi:methionyl-tRNA synthetase
MARSRLEKAMAKAGYYVTTPIYYVNDVPHIGHAYVTVLADVLAGYQRMLGRPTHFLTGTDEHGLKVQQAAQKAGITPQEQADRTVVRFQALWKKLGIQYDDFIRTTEERHRQVVRKTLQDLYDQGEIYKADYDGWYCVPDERFFTEKDLVDGNCPVCGRPVEAVKEANYFFRMGKYQEWLIQYIQEHPSFIQPDFRRNETLGFLRKPLQDLCISRPKSRLAWGIEMPFDANFVTYVWYDALVNYISAIGYGRDEAGFRKWWPASVHLIGKDILTTHTVYWPTMLKAFGLPLPETIFAHGWWLTGDSKMSKSLGNVVDPTPVIEAHGADAFRYFLMAEMSPGQDATYTPEAFIRRYNSDLANDLGNLLSRLLNMITRYTGGKIPAPPEGGPAGAEEKALWVSAQDAIEKMTEAVSRFKLDQGLAHVMAAVRSINKYLELKQPWTLARAEDKGPLLTVLYTAAECLGALAGLLGPVMPERMAVLRAALGLKSSRLRLSALKKWGALKPGAAVSEIPPLFPRVVTEKPEAPAPPPAPKTAGATATTAGDHALTLDEFARVQLRAAKIIEAERVPDSAKLLRLVVLIGNEKRQIVAGIGLYYDPAKLIGRTIVMVANLKPAKIHGVESQGMLLAASKGETLRLVTVDGEIASGAIIK